MCKSFIYWLQAGELPRYLKPGRNFELGNPLHFRNRITPTGEKILLNEKEMHCWLSGMEDEDAIDSKLLETVMSLKILMNVSETQWLCAIKTVNEKNEGLKRERLFCLLGKLQGWQNPQTENILVPEMYQKCPKLIHESSKLSYKEIHKSRSITKKEEQIIKTRISELLGPDAGLLDFQDLLGIENDVDKLFVALKFTKLK